MNIAGTTNSKNVVSLQELVPQHDCLKLLILHTPYTLSIGTLSLCVNLVKLDLSKNGLETFPYLGNLASLKFMFIHENRLDINALKGIFEIQGCKSSLSQRIVWVTFWGNKNAFLGRHYLANETSAIAVDRNMIVQQEKNPNFIYDSFESFSHETDLSSYFTKKGSVNRFASEEEYMRELWLQMGQLRKKYQKLFPIVKIQKVFRGWRVRMAAKRLKQTRTEFNQVLGGVFIAWKNLARRQAKLRKILKGRKKQYLLLDLPEMRRQQKIYRMIELAREIKRRFLNRKLSLKNQTKFFNIVRQNYLMLQNLYKELEMEKSQFVYVHRNQWDLFCKHVLPFLTVVNPESVVPQQNQRYCLHLLYEFHNEKTKQFIKILQTNLKSVAYDCFSYPKTFKKPRKPILYGCSLKKIYLRTKISKSKLSTVQEALKRVDAKKQIGLEQLVKIGGAKLLLKDIIRGVYFFNAGRLLGGNPEHKRIHVFSQFALKKVSSVTKIQKVWRGYSLRKKNGQSFRLLLKIQRATIIIQRWVRKLPFLKKRSFMFQTAKKIETLKDTAFYLQLGEYFNFLAEKEQRSDICSFNQIDSRPYIHTENNQLCFTWNHISDHPQVSENIRMKKPLISKLFLRKRVGFEEDQSKKRLVFESGKYNACSYAHIFHFDTQTSFLTKGKKKYIQVKCRNLSEARFRFLILLIGNYQLPKEKQINIQLSYNFRQRELVSKQNIKIEQTSFICNQNFNLIKQCEAKFRSQPNIVLHVINNRFYFQSDQRPLKIEEKFFIYSYQQLPTTQEATTVYEPGHRHATEPSRTNEASLTLLAENYYDTEVMPIKLNEPSKLKILIKKRSVKQHRGGKGIRRQAQPSFVLDSTSINERLTTQADVIRTQVSNQENSPLEHNIEMQSLEREEIKARQRLTHAQRRNQSLKRREQQSFTKRFINLGNFIQNQYANDYRRRIKTQLQSRAVDSADLVRREIQRSQSQKAQDVQQKHRKIREKHSQHRQLVEKTHSLMREHSQQVRHQAAESRDKRLKQRSKLKRLKVSFAEQCYPLASKHKKIDYFS